jgi:hypothetical protein
MGAPAKSGILNRHKPRREADLDVNDSVTALETVRAKCFYFIRN